MRQTDFLPRPHAGHRQLHSQCPCKLYPWISSPAHHVDICSKKKRIPRLLEKRANAPKEIGDVQGSQRGPGVPSGSGSQMWEFAS